VLDQTTAYRTSQVSTSTPLGQVVLLYEGAIRFATLHTAHLEAGRSEAAHIASIRAQEIVSGLREVLDPSAGPIAAQLDSLYDFVLSRLVDGNIRHEAEPTGEAIKILRGLLEAWQAIARGPAAVSPAFAMATSPTATFATTSTAGGSPVLAPPPGGPSTRPVAGAPVLAVVR
jgi:flagellar secretion chaperone FliS